MQISVYLVDWQEVLKRHSEGTLEEDIFEATDSQISSTDLEFLAEITANNSSSDTRQAVQDLLAEIVGNQDEGDSWVRQFDFPSDSHNLYCAIAECYEQLRQSLPITIRVATDEFMNSAIAFSGYCQDIEFTDSEFFTLAISPKSASKLCRVGTQIDFDRFEDLYISGCPEKLKAVLAKYSQSKDLNRSFQEVFLPYVKDWLNLMKVATQQERGILVGWG